MKVQLLYLFFIFFLSCFLFLPFALLSQGDLNNIRFHHIGIKEGLPNNSVFSLLQDRQGFIWIGTYEGLCRYDGYSFLTYKYNPEDTASISDNSVFCMAEDRDGKIWTGNRRKGLNVLDPRTGKFKRYFFNKEDSSSLNNPDVRSICVDNDGEIWIGTGRGLNKYVESTDNFIQYNSELHPEEYPSNIFKIIEAKNGLLWIACHSGAQLTSYDKNNGKFKRYIHDAKNPDSPSCPAIMTLCEDHSGMIWIGTWGCALDVFSPQTGSFIQHYRSDPGDDRTLTDTRFFRAGFLCDSDNNMWLGTAQDGLNIFHREKNSFIRYKNNPDIAWSLSNNSVRSIILDKTGIIWIGTEGGGLNLYDTKRPGFEVFQPVKDNIGALSAKRVSVIYEDKKGNIWIGSEGNGIDRMDVISGKFHNYKNIPGASLSLNSDNITAICEDGSGKLYVGMTDAGYCSYDEKYNNFRRESLPVHGNPISFIKDRNGNLWIATQGGGIKTFNGGKEIIFKGLKPIHHWINSLFEDKQGRIWIATSQKGVSVYLPDKDSTIHFQHDDTISNSLSHNVTNAIAEDGNGIIWVGTMVGLNAINFNTGKITSYYSQDGLPRDMILGILTDNDNNLWIATTDGLCLFKARERTFQTYDETDGLPSRDLTGAVLKDSKGKFYFGTAYGFISFFPGQIKNNPFKPECVITHLTVLNKPFVGHNISYTNEMTLSYLEYFFSLEFSALEFSAPGKNQYAYRLTGFNKDWIYLGNKREVTFTNLDAGNYILKVMASNNHGLWSEEKELLKIKITPPWWKTNLFYFLIATLLIISIVLFIKIREQKLKLEKKILEEKVSIRTSQLKDEKEKVDEANKEISRQKLIVEEKNKDVLDSIRYAQRIQDAILPPQKMLEKFFPDSFILYKPKDIVAGDFYWMHSVDSLSIQSPVGMPFKDPVAEHLVVSRGEGNQSKGPLLLAVCDCTGHGVPGAFVSIICHNALNRAVKEFCLSSPAEILDKVNLIVEEAFSNSEKEIKDGMDIALILIEKTGMQEDGENPRSGYFMQYSGANNSAYIVSENKIIEVKADKQPIGKYTKRSPFKNHRIELKKNDSIYLFSDGYADQFGGPKRKKFKYSQFEKLLLSQSNSPMKAQKTILNNTIESWRGTLEQIDDMCVIGLRI